MTSQKKTYCNKCKTETHHTVRFEWKKQLDDAIELTHSWNIYQIIQCNGCEDVSFCHISGNNENCDPETLERYDSEEINIFPKRNSGELENKRKLFLHKNIVKLYNETLAAYNEGLFILCLAGLRTTVEAICYTEKIKNGPVRQENGSIKKEKTLQGKINGLLDKNILTEKQIELLHTHRLLGDHAVHEFVTLDKNTLHQAIEMLDHILYTLYESEFQNEIILDTHKATRKQKNIT